MIIIDYDFAIFGSLIDIIAENFFPSSHTHDFAFLLSLAIYGSAFVMRPVGGVVIGYIGDKFTRKKALGNIINNSSIISN